MKTKDQRINVVKRWYSDIADLRTEHRLVVVVCDNAGEKKSQEIKEFFELKGIRSLIKFFPSFLTFMFSHFLIFAVSEEDWHVPKAYTHMLTHARMCAHMILL